MAQLECDLVMRGGITSGVVYPPAIARLAKTYRFRSIGGASAGAIAAGAAAAAEFGRTFGENPDAFEELGQLSTEIGDVLGRLFEPCRSARAPFRLFMLVLGYGRASANAPEAFSPLQRIVAWFRSATRLVSFGLRALWVLVIAYPAHVVLGLVPAAFVATGAFVAAEQLLPSQHVPPIGMAALVLALVTMTAVFESLLLALRLKKALTQELRETNFGMCSGTQGTQGTHPAAGSSAPGAQDRRGLPLTDWLHAAYQSLAGLPLDRPLTFGDLYGPDTDAGPARNDPRIELRVMTSCLTQGRPFAMPFAQDNFWWRPDEFEQLFGSAIVSAMKRPEYDCGDGYYKFPRAEDLPVLVAIRMSLSFPLLLWAVPLHGVDYTRAKPAEGERPMSPQWFSDGGICSNFPIHFFDSPWPTRPTFGITLQAAAKGDASELAAAPPDVSGMGIARRFRPIEGVGAFMGSIVDTMKDWQDNLQSTLPGYRGRIAVVHLREGEGGLNLDMPAAVVGKIAARGEQAGERLSEFDFPTHRWRRHLVWLEQLQRMLATGRARYGDPSSDAAQEIKPGVPTLRSFLVEYTKDPKDYKRAARTLEDTLSNLDALADLGQNWRDVLHERPDDRGRMRAHDFPHPSVRVQQVPSDALPRLSPTSGSGGAQTGAES